MKKYNLINNVTGWVAFLISAVTYILTTEDTASFWDCGEFISTADKLLVGHPPGAPLFMIIARLFAISAPNVYLVAKAVNIMSALASAFTILFLFWTITHLARKIFIDDHRDADGNVEPWRIWSVMGAGFVGALAYTFSDTFWFSAVEGEVYAMSSLFTAVVFWAILKWENVADEPGANRWIILIAYLMGLSIGVHLLNLLCIPAICLVYYFRKYAGRVTLKGSFITLAVSCVALGAILYGIIPGLVTIAGGFELFFVNSLGLGYNSGAIFWMLLLVAATIYGIIYTMRKAMVIANTIVTAFAVIVLGYSSFAMIVIRSAADPTMDQNSPDNVFALIDYLNREQYGDRPLFYGQTFASNLDYDNQEQGKPIYIKKEVKGKPQYVVADYKPIYKYQGNMLLPRMYSSQQSHIQEYKNWSNFSGRHYKMKGRDGRTSNVIGPSQADNVTFLFRYQIGWMYLRYFMWNFVGRQNDIQGHGDIMHGNWISGISFLDNMRLGDQDLMPDTLKANKAHNTYFFLPLLLGLAGLFFQYGRGVKGVQGFTIVMMLFFMTGLAIVLYLNQTPLQPRERDYAYAGSFYAFAIWIGLGVLSIIEGLRAYKCPAMVATVASVAACFLAVPCLMAQQNWDDHDRSGCTIARDIAYNYLNSCDENAVIFTNGDNDTFPLWYAQEVEGCRTDVRVCNLSYLQTEWYADQMKRKAYESDPLPISFQHDEYTHDRDVIYLFHDRQEAIPLKQAMDLLHSNLPNTRREGYKFLPGSRFSLEVDSAVVAQANVVSPYRLPLVAKQLEFNVPGSYILKNQMFVLDMLCNSGWKRPLYFAVTVGADNYCGLENYFQLEGLAYRISPVGSGVSYTPGSVDSEKMYDKVMNKFRWGFYNNPDVYYDENKMRMANNFRSNLVRLAEAFVEEAEDAAEAQDVATANDKRDKAREVLAKIAYELPVSIIPYNYFSLDMVHCYHRLGMDQEAKDVAMSYAVDNWQELNFLLCQDNNVVRANFSNVRRAVIISSEIIKVLEACGLKEAADEVNKLYSAHLDVAYSVFGDKLVR